MPAAEHKSLRGTPSQVELAQRLRESVAVEFDRVAKALGDATSKQSPQNQKDARAMIAILDDKRDEVMANSDAGYFIHFWQELSGRVRQLIAADPRYTALKAARAARRPRL